MLVMMALQSSAECLRSQNCITYRCAAECLRSQNCITYRYACAHGSQCCLTHRAQRIHGIAGNAINMLIDPVKGDKLGNPRFRHFSACRNPFYTRVIWLPEAMLALEEQSVSQFTFETHLSHAILLSVCHAGARKRD